MSQSIKGVGSLIDALQAQEAETQAKELQDRPQSKPVGGFGIAVERTLLKVKTLRFSLGKGDRKAEKGDTSPEFYGYNRDTRKYFIAVPQPNERLAIKAYAESLGYHDVRLFVADVCSVTLADLILAGTFEGYAETLGGMPAAEKAKLAGIASNYCKLVKAGALELTAVVAMASHIPAELWPEAYRLQVEAIRAAPAKAAAAAAAIRDEVAKVFPETDTPVSVVAETDTPVSVVAETDTP